MFCSFCCQVLQSERQASDSDSGPTADSQATAHGSGRDTTDSLSTWTFTSSFWDVFVATDSFLLWLLHWNKLLVCTLSVIIAQDMLLQVKSVVIVRFNVRLVSVGNFSVLPQIYWDSSTWFTLYMLFKITAKHLSGLVGIFHSENKHLDRWLLKGI